MISVIMPAYNAEKYIEESIRSVAQQTYSDWELIVIDDCSTDGTAEIVNKLQNYYGPARGRIKYIKNDVNLGVAASRNRGIAQAKGDWIALLDADDLWRIDKLQKVVDFCKGFTGGQGFGLKGACLAPQFIFTGSGFMSESGRSIDAYLSAPASIDFKRLCRQNVISCSSVVIRRELLLEHPFPDEAGIHEDFVVWLQILSAGIVAYGIDLPLLTYRLVPSSRSGNKLHAAGMTWRTYRFIGMPFAAAAANFVTYAFKSLFKYSFLR